MAGPRQAGAGVSPFPVAVVSPDSLDASWHRVYDFSKVDAVYVMSSADAASASWTPYVTTRRGGALVGGVAYDVAADEVLAVTDSAVISRTMVAIASDSLLDSLVDDALVGPCGHEPDIEGTVQADLLSRSVTSVLRGLDSAEPAVAVGEAGLHESPSTALSASDTGSIAVTLINPDSMDRGGWCWANPTPHP
jgi:hypothetical protein